MPIVSRGRSLTPANMRASDVAARMVERLAPMQQQRNNAALRVQGIPARLYNYLYSGTPCTCKSAEKQASVLSPDGKAPTGVINRLITGQEFTVTPYNMNAAKIDPAGDFYSQGNPNALFDFDVVGDNPEIANDIVDRIVTGDNGEFNPESIDDIIANFDAADAGFSDASCPVCFGSGFVGGYTPYRAHRIVFTPVQLRATGEVDYTVSPWKLEPCQFEVDVVLPRGAVAVEAFRAFNGKVIVDAQFELDNVPVTSVLDILARCDGQTHVLRGTVSEPITHIEIQFALSTESSYFEIPKLSKSSDLSLLDTTDSFQILLSSDVPVLAAMDVIAEGQQGKFLLVKSVTPWQTRSRSVLGWECEVRMIQPQELFYILPTPGKVLGQRVANSTNPSIFKTSSGVK